jgi:hypothetical protein
MQEMTKSTSALADRKAPLPSWLQMVAHLSGETAALAGLAPRPVGTRRLVSFDSIDDEPSR